MTASNDEIVEALRTSLKEAERLRRENRRLRELNGQRGRTGDDTAPL